MKKDKEKSAIDLIIKLYLKKTSSGVGIQFDPITIVEINLLRSLLSYDCLDYHIIKAITSISDITQINLKTFEDSIKQITKSEKLRDHLTKWKILIPLEVVLRKRQIKINGLTFNVISYKTLKKTYPTEYYLYFQGQKLQTEKIENRKCRYLVIESNGSSLYNAWKNIEPTFNVLRGLFEFILSYGQWTFFTIPNFRTMVKHPETVYGISSDSKQEFLKFILLKTKPGLIEFKKNQIPGLNKYLNVLKKKPKENSLINLISDIFRIYSQAMEEYDLQYGFLKFWQMAERIALSDPGGPSASTVKKRLTFFTNPTPDFDMTPYIEKLSIKRNKLVHRGIDDIEESDFNILKSICERAIVWLYSKRRNFITLHHLELYYTSKDLDQNKINATIETLAYIKKERKK